MRVPVGAGVAVAGLVVAGAVTLAACGSASAPVAGGTRAHPDATMSASLATGLSVHTGATKPAAMIGGPPAGSRPEAAALARSMLSELRLPAGARRLRATPVPQALRQPSLWALATASLDIDQLYEVPLPMQSVAAMLTANVPAGTSLAVTGQSSGPTGVTSEDVSYEARSLPAGVNMAQLAVTMVPDGSGGSLVRADAQVIWYPQRSAAEYIDPARYHVLTLAVTIYNPRLHIIRKLVTSPAAIRRLAGVLDRSRVDPTMTISCPEIFAEYRLEFAVSGHSSPVVVVTASGSPCEGARVRADGRIQPSLQDAAGVVAAVDRLLGVIPRL
jgi:hypothetical protein